MVDNLHAECSPDFLCNRISDVPKAYDAKGMAARVVRLEGDLLVRICPFGGRIRTRGEGGPGHVTENGEDMVQRHVSHGFGGGVCAIAVKNSCIHMEQVSAKILFPVHKEVLCVSDAFGIGDTSCR